MGLCNLLFLLFASISAILAENFGDGELVINATSPIAHTDGNYICATIDWWPHDKCDYNQCPWGNSSVINLDLSHPVLAKAVQAFDRLRIRVGGSLQDQVVYDVGNSPTPCHPFQKMEGGLFGFSEGCLHMERWDELNHFFTKTRALGTFGLNALRGRHEIRKGVWGGDWNSSNSYDFIKYTISKGYQIDSWEFGNELSGNGVGASVDAEQYGKDVIGLRKLIDNLYRNLAKPLLLAPGGFYDGDWFAKLLQVSGPETVNIITHHIYNLGAGVDPDLVKKILDPYILTRATNTFYNLRETIQINGPWVSAWVGEAGGAYNSGGRDVSDTFVNSFWYLDQLGMAAQFDNKVYCRQSLVGGNYGLLSRTTFVPNPDYYSALLWHRLMGPRVLVALRNHLSPYLRPYAHCSKGQPGITLLLINLSNEIHFKMDVRNILSFRLHPEDKTTKNKTSFAHGLKTTVSGVATKATNETLPRFEYHLTPEGGYIRSKTMLLNGKPLELTDGGDIPVLEPMLINENSRLSLPPLSIKFIHLPNFEAPGCK